ncbi:Hypothetical predicted protein [Olea europaea subsp. europaea]|uniref:Uncharacterized protein n=1 Tax=Olea europaea subsp. europaea TaxID=158383 RepID=A0A8S0TBL0_OLEEU|nr:Hypothetical predicted protein [Olea europaea subsp. europaea]
MKFLLELVTCYGSSSTDSEVRQPAEESRSLVASGARRRVGGKLGKVVGVKSAGEWSPTLSSISENNFLSERNNQPRPHVVGFNKNLKRKVGSKYQDPSYCDDSRRASISATVPAFSPTAFLF